MSLRYVWNRYNMGAVVADSASGNYNSSIFPIILMNSADVFWQWGIYSSDEASLDGIVYSYVGSSYSISNGKLVINNPTIEKVPQSRIEGFRPDGSKFTNKNSGYVGFASTDNQNSFDAIYYWNVPAQGYAILQPAMLWDGGSSYTDTYIVGRWPYSGASGTYKGYRYVVGKGTLSATVSNAASTTYPLNNNVNPIAIICTILLLAVRGCYGVK